MIPYFRIKLNRYTERFPNRRIEHIGSYIEEAIHKVMKRVGRPITESEYLKLSSRYAEMISGNPASTMKSIYSRVEYSGFGRFVLHDCEFEPSVVREISFYRNNKLNYEGETAKFSYVGDREKIIYERNLNIEIVNRNLWHMYYHFPQRSKSICWFIRCSCCEKVEKKSTVMSDDVCRSCGARLAHYKKNEKETVEVNRLINKLKKVIKNESKRLTQETS